MKILWARLELADPRSVIERGKEDAESHVADSSDSGNLLREAYFQHQKFDLVLGNAVAEPTLSAAAAAMQRNLFSSSKNPGPRSAHAAAKASKTMGMPMYPQKTTARIAGNLEVLRSGWQCMPS